MRRPLLLLDIDGTLCPFDIPEGAQERFSQRMAHSTPVWVGPHMIGALERLSELYEIHWCSGWEEAANTVGELHGLPPLPHVQFVGTKADLHLSWKLGPVLRYLENHLERPVAWIDDELREDAYEWADQRAAPTLLIATDPQLGITVEELDRLLQFGHLHT